LDRSAVRASHAAALRIVAELDDAGFLVIDPYQDIREFHHGEASVAIMIVSFICCRVAPEEPERHT
jgi:hypothetical protein